MTDHVASPQMGAELETKTGKYKPSLKGWSHVTHATGADQAPNAPGFQVMVGCIMIGFLLLTSVSVGKQENRPPAPTPAPTAEAASDALAADFNAMKSDMDALASRLKDLRKKVDALPKPEPMPDVAPLQGKLESLTKTLAAVGPLAERVDRLDGHLVGTTAVVKTLHDDLGGLQAGLADLKKTTPSQSR